MFNIASKVQKFNKYKKQLTATKGIYPVHKEQEEDINKDIQEITSKLPSVAL